MKIQVKEQEIDCMESDIIYTTKGQRVNFIVPGDAKFGAIVVAF
jgi:ethanolamine utilization protein EutQ (cupin superfamily)